MNANQSATNVFQPRSWSPRLIAGLRVAVGLWLLLLTAILYRAGVSGPWELVLVAVAVLHFGLAYRLFGVANDEAGTSPERYLTQDLK